MEERKKKVIFSRCTVYLLQYHALVSREIQGLCEILKFASKSEDAESKSSPMQLPMGRKPQKSYEERPSLACVSFPWVWMNRKSVLVASGSLLVIVQAVGMNQFKIQESGVLFAGYYIPSHANWVPFQVHHGPHLPLIMTGLLQFSSVAQPCPTLCNPMNC